MAAMINLDPHGTWLTGVHHCPSPNCDARPDGMTIELLVIHGISLPPGEFGGPYIDQLFTNTLNPEEHPYFADIVHLRVSAHLLIRRTGEVTQYVSFQQRAWHAGISGFMGRSQCNNFSIGIELEGCDNVLYTEAQYQQLAHLIKLLQQHWPQLTDERIVGHSDIAPGRKTDPGPAFDWNKLRNLVVMPSGW